MTALTLTPAVATALSLFNTPQTLYPSSSLYPSSGIFPGVALLTLTAAGSTVLTLTPA